jgi:hypothetical protein
VTYPLEPCTLPGKQHMRSALLESDAGLHDRRTIPGFLHSRSSASRPDDRSRVGNRTGLRLDRWDTGEAVHESLLAGPGDVIGTDQFNIGEGAQRAAAKRGIGADTCVLVQPDGVSANALPRHRPRCRQRVANSKVAASRIADSTKLVCFEPEATQPAIASA